MAASVRIEDEAFSDLRYVTLARVAGLADVDHALGKMARIWRQCTIEQKNHLVFDDVTNVLGEHGADALVAARLGEIVTLDDDENTRVVRIKGAEGRIEWLSRLRENGKKGGRPRTKAPNHLVSQLDTKREVSGLEKLNPPAPAPAPAPTNNTRRKRAEAKEASPEALKAAQLLADLIRQRDPKAKVKPESWADDLDKLHRIDGREWSEIEDLITRCQADKFERSNVMSGSKLRMRFTQLKDKLAKPSGSLQPGQRAGNGLQEVTMEDFR